MRTVRFLLIVVWAAGCAACGTTGAVPRPFPGASSPAGRPSRPPDPAAAQPGERSGRAAAPGLASGDDLARRALALRGAPYRNGGADPSGFDCSGFVHYLFVGYGWLLPRSVGDLYQMGGKVDRDEIRAGDLVFFTTVKRGASHVGIAIGGGAFVHAPSSRGVVRVERLEASYWDRRFVGARRLTD